MNAFEHPNFSDGQHCPICGLNDDKEVILIPIYGTEDGNICEAAQVHTKCLQNHLALYPESKMIACGIKSTTFNQVSPSLQPN